MEPAPQGSHHAVFERLFQHPAPKNLEWREVVALLNSMPDVQTDEDANGRLKVVRGGHTLTLHRPNSKDFSDIEQVMQLRHFLQSSSTTAQSPPGAGPVLLVAIDHHGARIFHVELEGSRPVRIKPYDPFGFGLHVRHHADGFDGKRPHELKSYYENVIKTMHNAKEILLFGVGTGASSAMDYLLHELERHPELSQKVVQTIRIDEHHFTDDQLLAKAREIYSVSRAGGVS
jgi:hypothetical protein